MSEFIVEEMQHSKGAKIKIVGCGGGGGNMINHMMRVGLNNLDLIAANTDGQALNKSLAKTKIQLGSKLTKGLGAGGDPQVGIESAKEAFEELKSVFENCDIVFLASGFGGGTGTGATPIVAKAAKEMGALTVSVVTMPFAYEGDRKKKLAQEGLNELKKESDSILVIQNEKVKNLIDKNAPAREAYALVDDVLAKAVKGMVSLLLDNGQINVDFADVKTIMTYRGLALMGVGSGEGQNAAEQALANALECPLLDGLDVKNAQGIILNVRHNPNFPFMQMADAVASLQNSVGENINFKLGYSEDESMQEDKIEMTIIATGFENKENKAESKSQSKANDYLENIGMKKTGTLDMEELGSYLDAPTYLRKQMD